MPPTEIVQDDPQAPPEIALTPVHSSNVDAMGYDEASKTLAVRFRGGATYHYAGVEPHEWNALKSSPSKGSHVHQFIRSNHKTTRIR